MNFLQKAGKWKSHFLQPSSEGERTKVFLKPEGRFYYSPTVGRKKPVLVWVFSLMLLCGVCVCLSKFSHVGRDFSLVETSAAQEAKPHPPMGVKNSEKQLLVPDEAALNSFLEHTLPVNHRKK